MKHLLCALIVLSSTLSFSQTGKPKAEKYPSLLWEIRSKHSVKPSYLFGTMHVSSKMAFNLSDSFYVGIRAAQVVALETNPGTWQEDFSRYDVEGESRYANTSGAPSDYLNISTLQLNSYEKLMEAALHANPSMLNNFLYRSRAGQASDFEEDTYLDLHIFQTGRKLGKKICGVEDFDGSMQLVKEAYTDAVKDRGRGSRSSADEDFSYSRLEEAYRTGNLDLLDTINKVNSQSAAFDEKFLYRRNEIQAKAIDSILKKGNVLFVGVGAAHLPGDRGVIEWLRKAGYTLRPVRMAVRDHRFRDAIEKVRVPVQFSKQTAADGFFSVNAPGKLYAASSSLGLRVQHYADMTNGSYYLVSRVLTNAALLGQTTAKVERKLDSVLYENIPGKMLTKQNIVRNGYRGFDILNRTRRGDYQRHQIFVTPFEILVFKMSGNGDYVTKGTEATQFFSSIQLKPTAPTTWRRFSPAAGGFEAEFPGEPVTHNSENLFFSSYDPTSASAFTVIRTDVHNHSFLEEDTFDLALMEESFGSSPFIYRRVSRRLNASTGYPALDAVYVFKDSSAASVRFLLHGPHYYTLIAKTSKHFDGAQRFINSFRIVPFRYGNASLSVDTSLKYSVRSVVPIHRKNKLSMYPEDFGYSPEGDDSLADNGTYESRLITADSTGEKIFVSYFRESAYSKSRGESSDSAVNNEWVFRKHKVDTLSNGTVVMNAEFGAKNSSRMLRVKTVDLGGAGYEVQTQLDTLSAPSAFVESFFGSFKPLEDVGVAAEKRSAVFFSQFFSRDTLLHKRAVKNISNVSLDSSDFNLLKKSIESLSWRERKYLEVKKEFVRKVAAQSSREASDYLQRVYLAAGDTLELQHTALESLLLQGTPYAYKIFGSIMENDPPVLTGASSLQNNASVYRRSNVAIKDHYEGAVANADGSFLDNLTDSLQLTAGIYKNLIPLWNLDDYEQSLLELSTLLLDSGRIEPRAYEAYVPKLLIQARQDLKKQVIREKAKAIEKAQEDESERGDYLRYEPGNTGNEQLVLYAKLLLPYWDRNPQVAALLVRMLSSDDRRLQFNTLLLLLHNNRPVPDSLLHTFATLDEFRYELYTQLFRTKKLDRFPAAFQTQELLARSRLFSAGYEKPDTVAFLRRMPLTHKDRGGYVYVFRYKENKNDAGWKLATVGLLPDDTAAFYFDGTEADTRAAREYDFTELTNEKLSEDASEEETVQKLLRRLLYSKRKSAAQFYDAVSGQYNEMINGMRD